MDGRMIAEILGSYRNGDGLPDHELEQLRAAMEKAAAALAPLGDLFTLQYGYARRVADDCREFQRARSARSA